MKRKKYGENYERITNNFIDSIINFEINYNGYQNDLHPQKMYFFMSYQNLTIMEDFLENHQHVNVIYDQQKHQDTIKIQSIKN